MLAPPNDHEKKNTTKKQKAIKLPRMIPSLLFFAPILVIRLLIPGIVLAAPTILLLILANVSRCTPKFSLMA